MQCEGYTGIWDHCPDIYGATLEPGRLFTQTQTTQLEPSILIVTVLFLGLIAMLIGAYTSGLTAN